MISRRDLLRKSGLAGLGGIAGATLGYLFPELRRASAQEGDPEPPLDLGLWVNATAAVGGLANVTANLGANTTPPGFQNSTDPGYSDSPSTTNFTLP